MSTKDSKVENPDVSQCTETLSFFKKDQLFIITKLTLSHLVVKIITA